ncbi:MAG: hypothetical protein GX256_09240 [Fretibacterium sp.]|nr:hypothetical protein [Fretibacterium sp.]
MSTTLRIHFTGQNGRKLLHSFSNASSAATPEQVQAVADAVLANGDIYADSPLALEKAEFYTAQTTPITLP